MPGAAAGTVAPPPDRLIVLDVHSAGEGLSAGTRAGLLHALVAECQAQTKLEVTSVEELRRALDLEADRQQIGCKDASCATEIADAYGARFVLFTSVARLGASWSLTTSLFDSREARVIGRGMSRANGVARLAEGIGTAVAESLGPLATRPSRAGPLGEGGPRGPAPVAGTAAPVARATLRPDQVPLEAEPLTAYDARRCVYDDDAGAWSCGARRVPVAIARHGSSATTGEVRFTVDLSRGCPSGVDVEIDGGEQGASVTWSEAAAQYDGVAVALKPRSGVSAAVRIPPGSAGRESLLIAGGCLGSGDLPADKASDSAAISIPFIVDGAAASAIWVRRRAWEERAEAELLALVPEPPLPLKPDALVDDPPGSPFLLGGLTLGLLSSAAVGTAVGAWVMPKSSTAEQRLLVGAGYGGVGLCCLATPAAILGAIVDAARSSDYASKADASAAWRYAERKRAAWARRGDGGSGAADRASSPR
ncbi:MAG: hypothetical protein IT383_11320 [Deltaproteobacteria bacterium]|nr:hypothetical protein [Deltaproteobacteria bacterium]